MSGQSVLNLAGVTAKACYRALTINDPAAAFISQVTFRDNGQQSYINPIDRVVGGGAIAVVGPRANLRVENCQFIKNQ